MADLLEPQTREEQFLRAAATGDTSQMPTPVTRVEMFLAYIAENGGGGGGGGGGESTIAWRPSVSADGTISWSRTSSTTPPTPVNVKGEKGDKGAQGEQGAQGDRGDKGDKGDKGDTGEQGAKGDIGEQGAKGDKGDDGYSPTITVTDITGGHRVTIVDKNHPQGQSFDVMDGEGGQAESVDWSKITNKPAGLVEDSSYVHTDNNYTTSDKDKLASLENYDDTALAARVTANETAIEGKQDALESGTNVKTVNGNSIMGAGNLVVGSEFEVGAEKWYGTYTENGVTYQVYSKLLNIGALPSAAGTTQYPHGITGIKQILQINGFTNDGFVMNAPRQNAQDNISIYQAQKSGNITVEVGKDRSSKNGFVMLIYAKNN